MFLIQIIVIYWFGFLLVCEYLITLFVIFYQDPNSKFEIHQEGINISFL